MKKKKLGKDESAPKKKGKLSKAERLRLQKEEEEQRLREIEEARLQAEQKEAEKLEKERLEKEERERLEAKELEQREEKLTELGLLLEDKFAVAEKWKSELRAQAKWERYMKCDGSPDPTVLHEINTFISLWKEVQNEDIQSVFYKSNLVINLIQELEFILLDTPSHELSENEIIQYKETILDLQTLLWNKHNEGIEHLLKQASALADIDTGNLQMMIKDKNVNLYIWANLNKNPRFKGYEFSNEIGFELPKPLALSNIVICILHTCYDHLSPQSSSFSLHVKKEIEETKSLIINTLEESSGEEMKPPEMENNTGVENIPTHDEEKRKSGVSFNSSARENLNEGQQQTGDESVSKTEIHPEEMPVPILSLLLQSEPEEALEDDIVDLRQFTPLGGIYHFDLLKLPPQSKQLKDWSILQLLEGGLQTYSYPLETLQTATPRQEKESDTVFPPVGVSFNLPKDVIFFEEPQVARWDPQGKNWRTDHITSKTYHVEEDKFSFKMNSFYTFTLFQNAYINMPYLSWELRPEGMNTVIFTISSTFTDVQLEIKDNQCRLNMISSEVNDTLSHIRKKWMTPFALKTALKRAGLNLFPTEKSDKFVSIIKKNNQVEKTAYEQIALLCPCYYFRWSKWNAVAGYENIVLKVKEFSKTGNDSWLLYMLSDCRAQRLNITESSTIFSDHIPENCEFHSSLYHAVKVHASDTTVEYIKNSHYQFIDCVHQLLTSTKVLTYS